MKGKGRRVPQPPDARLRDQGPRMNNIEYEGAVIHFVQIGLGTNSTFVQNAVGSRVEWNRGLQWLEGCMSARKQGYMTGIAIEPVFELAQAQWKAARELPWVEVVQVAMGEYCMREAKMSVFGETELQEVLETCARFPDEDLARELEYFRNMSCIGDILPGFAKKQLAAERRYGAMIRVQEQSVEQWDWARLVGSCRFLTCEVLVIDTEGSDTNILRSLIRHCRRHPNSWPYVIQFETMGHCDVKDGKDAEWNMTRALEDAQYMLVVHGDHNTIMVHRKAFQRHRRIFSWVSRIQCAFCGRCGTTPFAAERGGYRCGTCVSQLYWKVHVVKRSVGARRSVADEEGDTYIKSTSWQWDESQGEVRRSEERSYTETWEIRSLSACKALNIRSRNQNGR